MKGTTLFDCQTFCTFAVFQLNHSKVNLKCIYLRATVVATCLLDLRSYPMDVQLCDIGIESCKYLVIFVQFISLIDNEIRRNSQIDTFPQACCSQRCRKRDLTRPCVNEPLLGLNFIDLPKNYYGGQLVKETLDSTPRRYIISA